MTREQEIQERDISVIAVDDGSNAEYVRHLRALLATAKCMPALIQQALEASQARVKELEAESAEQKDCIAALQLVNADRATNAHRDARLVRAGMRLAEDIACNYIKDVDDYGGELRAANITDLVGALATDDAAIQVAVEGEK